LNSEAEMNMIRFLTFVPVPNVKMNTATLIFLVFDFTISQTAHGVSVGPK